MLCKQKSFACTQQLFSQSINVPMCAAEISTHFILVVYIGINFYVVSICVKGCEILMVVEIEILVCWAMIYATACVVTLGSEEWPSFIFRVGW